MNFKIIGSKERSFELIILKIVDASLKSFAASATWRLGFVEPW
jgi:hypothetical protein